MKQDTRRTERILIIDGESLVGRWVGILLKRAGFDVRSTASSLEGLHQAIESPPDLIITGYQMPDLNGDELCVHLKSREETRRVPVVLMSARSGSGGRQVAEFSGADAYLEQPVVSGRLARTVQGLLARNN